VRRFECSLQNLHDNPSHPLAVRDYPCSHGGQMSIL
jgi:hypothetical protein